MESPYSAMAFLACQFPFHQCIEDGSCEPSLVRSCRTYYSIPRVSIQSHGDASRWFSIDLNIKEHLRRDGGSSFLLITRYSLPHFRFSQLLRYHCAHEDQHDYHKPTALHTAGFLSLYCSAALRHSPVFRISILLCLCS